MTSVLVDERAVTGWKKKMDNKKRPMILLKVLHVFFDMQ
jgi:hypothetical protein